MSGHTIKISERESYKIEITMSGIWDIVPALIYKDHDQKYKFIAILYL